ncbi:MAG: hypothetical protein H5U13_00035 [Parvibaculum sp.]|nr:hypothetical protein [Parvibaculum sp.]
MTEHVPTHPWSSDSLLAKASVYMERMESNTPEDSQFGFWSALCLELLARAALARISPILLADHSNWRNLTYALGHQATAKKFAPSSISTSEALGRLTELLPSFTQEIAGFCGKHADRRNAELHTGELAFDALGTADWLPKFYQACRVLLQSMGLELENFVADPRAARMMIESLEDEAAKAVQQDIKAHAQVWQNKEPEEREDAKTQALSWAIKQSGHRVVCPACGCTALVQGSPSGIVATSVNDDEVRQKQAMLPTAFECIACGLRISGLSKLSACGLGNAFTATSTYSAAEFFGLDLSPNFHPVGSRVC